MINQELSTSRLKLVRLEKRHLDDLFKIYSNPNAMLYWDDFPHKDKEKTDKLLNLFQKREKEKTGVCWGIKIKGKDEIVGTIAYNSFKENGNSTIGFILAEHYWNKGIITEALEEMINYGFSQLHINRIEALVTPGNTSSEKVLKKLGFQNEGLLRQRYFFKDKHQDAIVYGLLASEKKLAITQG